MAPRRRPWPWCSHPSRGSRSCIVTSSHHGGARVRQIVVEPSVALDEEYDVLVVSDRWPALTLRVRPCGARAWPRDPRCVRSRRARGQGPPRRRSASTRRSRPTPRSGSSSPRSASSTPPRRTTLGRPRRAPAIADVRDDGPSGVLVAVSGPRGSGVTEVALGVAAALAERRARSCCSTRTSRRRRSPGGSASVSSPTCAARSTRARTVWGRSTTASSRSSSAGGGRLGAVAGHPSAIAASQVSTQDVLDVVDARTARARRRGRRRRGALGDRTCGRPASPTLVVGVRPREPGRCRARRSSGSSTRVGAQPRRSPLHLS